MTSKTYTVSAISNLSAPLPERKQDRIRELFKIHTQLNQKYGELYRDANLALKKARELAADSNGPDNLSDQEKEEIVTTVSQVRTDTVLFFKSTIARTEFLINELLPGTFPVESDQPLGSFDLDDLYNLGEGLAGLGAGLSAIGLGAIGAIIGGIGLGMMGLSWAIGALFGE